MARPTKSPDEKRTDTMRFRVTAFERARIEDAAAAAGIDPSEFCRRRCLSYRIPPARSVADARLTLEINRIGVNLNQITARLNATGDTEKLADDVGEVLADIRQAMGKVLADGA